MLQEIVAVEKCWNKTKCAKAARWRKGCFCSDLKWCGAGNTRKVALDAFWNWSLHLHVYLFFSIIYFFCW